MESVIHKGASANMEFLDKAELFVFPAGDRTRQRDNVGQEWKPTQQYCNIAPQQGIFVPNLRLE